MSSTDLNSGSTLVSIICLLIIAYVITHWDCSNVYQNNYKEGMKMESSEISTTTTINGVTTSQNTTINSNDENLSTDISKQLDWIVPTVITGIFIIVGIIAGAMYWYKMKKKNKLIGTTV